MGRYIVRRLIPAIPVLFGLSIILFAFIHLLPGDPAASILGQHATPELVAEIRAELGLDKPLWQQYVDYMGKLVQGDFGKSIINNRPIVDEFLRRFPGTVELTMAALLFAWGSASRWAGSPPATCRASATAWSRSSGLLGISIPIFVLGLTLQYIFAVQLKILPAAGRLDPAWGSRPHRTSCSSTPCSRGTSLPSSTGCST